MVQAAVLPRVPVADPAVLAVELHRAGISFMTDRSEVVALSDVSLTLPQGAFLTLLSPSGCGKSTLLRLVADTLPPTTGSVRVLGAPPAVARARRQIGFVFQNAALLPWRSMIDNVRLLLQVGPQPAAGEPGGSRGAEELNRAAPRLGDVRAALPALAARLRDYSGDCSPWTSASLSPSATTAG